ncbi:flagellar hook-basal body protein [Niallia sp. Krafla_26]|uniref:flagellar hook-basal body protein n=1 Tax=Niallia sp. Krafla_26 TaxID=3064703 RepID=UPI003D165030
MLRGFYTAASGMLAQQRKTEMLANNMSNANTPGFKADQSAIRAFPEMLLQRMDKGNGVTPGSSRTIGSLNTGVYMQEVMPKFLQGDLKETGLKTDVALLDVSLPTNPETGMVGSTFFTVEGNDGGRRYTRNGNFTLDGAGFLTTGSGAYVLDQQGNRIGLPSDQFVVNDEGQIIVGFDENQEVVARIGIAYTNDPHSMVKEGDGLFRFEGGNLADAYNVDGLFVKTQQGFLEQSNVDTAQTMTEMMAAYRTFEANQKVLQAYDTSLQKTVNEVGRIG